MTTERKIVAGGCSVIGSAIIANLGVKPTPDIEKERPEG